MFCEECGCKLEDGLKFCENCGTLVSNYETLVPNENQENKEIQQENLVDFDIFSDSNWSSKYKEICENSNNKIGIIFIKSSILKNQLSCSDLELKSLLSDYISFSKTRFIDYFLLDLDSQKISPDSSNSLKNCIEIQSAIEKVFHQSYIFILGNENVIPFATWKNESEDSDEDVTSDFPYATFDLSSVWNGQKYDFDSLIRVGRLPTWKGENFYDFNQYFDNAKKGIENLKQIVPYGLSALIWQNESNNEFSSIFSKKVDTSPNLTRHNVDSNIPNNANLFFFNLHGSNETEYWYGQEGIEYPEAFSPQNISKIQNPYFLGVEACYGAIFEDGREKSDSIVQNALVSGCISFLGSSRIAYGTSNPPGSCADIVISNFLEKIKNGESSGDSFIFALKKLCQNEMDDSDLKTLCEFSLFGDPTARIGENKNVSKSFGIKSIFSKSKSKKSITVPIPNVRNAVRLSLATVDSKISDSINKLIYQKYPTLENVIPKTYALSNSDIFQSIFQTKQKIVKVYFDKSGKITKEIESK